MTLLVLLTDRSSNAFSVTGTQTGSQLPYTPKDPFTGKDIPATGTVKTYDISSLTPLDVSTSNEFMTALQNSGFSDWTFNKGMDLKGSFNVLKYLPCNPDTACGVSQNPNSANVIKKGQVGAVLDLKYISGNGDPQLGATEETNKIHWIQQVVLKKTYPGDSSSTITENFIDIGPQSGQVQLPYYDASYSLFPDSPSLDRFIDRAYQDTFINYTFLANLYLVEETAPKIVTIYNGVSWGWESKFTPPPTGGDGCDGSSGGGGCPTVASVNKTLNQNLSHFNSSYASQPSKSVPEPVSALGLLALGAWGVFQGLKIRKDT